jgi:hypothetical protein
MRFGADALPAALSLATATLSGTRFTSLVDAVSIEHIGVQLDAQLTLSETITPPSYIGNTPDVRSHRNPDSLNSEGKNSTKAASWNSTTSSRVLTNPKWPSRHPGANLQQTIEQSG